MNGPSPTRAVIHQSIARPLLLAGAERGPAVANWICAAGILFGGGLHWYTIAASALLVTVGAVGFDSGRQVRPGAEPRVPAAHPLSAMVCGAFEHRCSATSDSVPTVREMRW